MGAMGEKIELITRCVELTIVPRVVMIEMIRLGEVVLIDDGWDW